LTRCCRAAAGIGKSLAQKLAAQGLNVVLVALDVRAGRRARAVARALSHTLGSCVAAAQEPLLDDTHGELKSAFPQLQFRKARAHAAASQPTRRRWADARRLRLRRLASTSAPPAHTWTRSRRRRRTLT
jgi:NAD(P)-dependent dehydrogenase (short-subunit alcohol dehydrogenase family)